MNKAKFIEKEYIPYGEGEGISLQLFSNGLRAQRLVKEKDGWKVEQEFFFSRMLLEKLYARIPYFLIKIKECEKR